MDRSTNENTTLPVLNNFVIYLIQSNGFSFIWSMGAIYNNQIFELEKWSFTSIQILVHSFLRFEKSSNLKLGSFVAVFIGIVLGTGNNSCELNRLYIYAYRESQVKAPLCSSSDV